MYELLDLSEGLEKSYGEALFPGSGIEPLKAFLEHVSTAVLHIEKINKKPLIKERSFCLLFEKSIQNAIENPKRFAESQKALDSTLVKRIYLTLQNTLAKIDIEKKIKENQMKTIVGIAQRIKTSNMHQELLPKFKSFLVIGAITLAAIGSCPVAVEAAGFGQPNITYLEAGIVRGVKQIEINDARMETGVGAVVGGVAGSFFGKGNSAKAVGIGLGAITGGVVGNAVAQVEHGQEIKVALDSVENGYRKIYTYTANGSQFKQGDCVQVKIDKNTNTVIDAKPSQCVADSNYRNERENISQFNANNGYSQDRYIRN